MIKENSIHQFSNGVKVVNTTPHACTFDDNGELVTIEPCGVLLNATIKNELKEESKVQGNIIKFVIPTFETNRDGENFIEFMAKNHSDVLIVGSIIAAQAYPGKVVSMVPCEGFERVPPAEKRMRIDMFTIYTP